jgi:glycosyltransferase involved in cell wall biosynthesis
MNKPVLAILTEAVRRDNLLPLKFFSKIEIKFFYERAPYNDLEEEDLKGLVKFNNFSELYNNLLILKPDIIQGSEPYGSKKMFIMSAVAYMAAKKLKIPLIFPVLENRPANKRFKPHVRMIVDWFFKKYIKESKKILYLNKGAKENLLKLNAPESKLIPFLWGIWGVDINEFTTPRTKNYQSKFKNLLFVGRLDEAKGIKYLLEAFKIIYKRMPNIKLTIVGDGELKNSVLEFRNKNFLENKIILKGIIKNKDLPSYFQEADLTILPSVTLYNWEEQIGMTNIQSMSCGTPVISTKSGAISEYVPDGKAGILVPERKSEELAKAVIKLLEDNELRKKMGEFARDYSVKNYNAKLNIEKAEAIILDILQK